MNQFIKLAEKRIPSEVFSQLSLFEVFPSQKTLILAKGNHTALQMIPSFWGMQNQNGALIINARSETYLMKGLFAGSFPVIIPCSAYYEWDKKTKIKYRCFSSEKNMFMGGIAKALSDMCVFAILTRDAIPPQSTIHHRMPILLSKADALGYLNGSPLKDLEVQNIEFMEAV